MTSNLGGIRCGHPDDRSAVHFEYLTLVDLSVVEVLQPKLVGTFRDPTALVLGDIMGREGATRPQCRRKISRSAGSNP